MHNLNLLLMLLLLSVVVTVQAAGKDFTPTNDQQVVEKLSARLEPNSGSPHTAAISARKAITLARETADTRYLGRAQAILAPWWDKMDAPVELAVLQATVLQSRHEFEAAKSVLGSALKRDAHHAQGWLTMATLERLSGNYPSARLACEKVARAGATLHAQACQLETLSLTGNHDLARRAFQALQMQTTDGTTQAWLLSLQAENDERAGRDALALSGYQSSLSLASDNYTALAAADLLLRTQRPREAQALLKTQPSSDAVLLRRTLAAKMQQDPTWPSMAKALHARFSALDQRGDARITHAREQALVYLWLDADGPRALEAAKLNLTLQKEPFDWWLAMASAKLAGQTDMLQSLREQVASIGLNDARLSVFRSK